MTDKKEISEELFKELSSRHGGNMSAVFNAQVDTLGAIMNVEDPKLHIQETQLSEELTPDEIQDRMTVLLEKQFDSQLSQSEKQKMQYLFDAQRVNELLSQQGKDITKEDYQTLIQIYNEYKKANKKMYPVLEGFIDLTFKQITDGKEPNTVFNWEQREQESATIPQMTLCIAVWKHILKSKVSKTKVFDLVEEDFEDKDKKYAKESSTIRKLFNKHKQMAYILYEIINQLENGNTPPTPKEIKVVNDILCPYTVRKYKDIGTDLSYAKWKEILAETRKRNKKLRDFKE